MAKTDEVLERILAADKLAAADAAAPETPMVGCECDHHKDGHAIGYALGIEHATEEFQSRAPVAAPAAAAPTPPVLTIDEVMTRFAEWQAQRSEYWQWEVECMAALREALAPGDTVLPRFAYSCVVKRADGSEFEFIKRPRKVAK